MDTRNNRGIDASSVRDFVGSMGNCSPAYIVEVLDDLLELLPYLADADSGDGEDRLLRAFQLRRPDDEIRRILGRRFTQELFHYLPAARAALIVAARDVAKKAADTREALNRCYTEVVRELQQLDNRTRGLLEIREILAAASPTFRGGDYSCIVDELPPADMDVLRSEPGLEATMRAYDLAVRVLDQQSDLTA